MRHYADRLLLSASDLTRFMGCAHATTLDLAHLEGQGPEPGEDSEDATLLQRLGAEHEARHLEALRAAGREVVTIAAGDLAQAAEATRQALRNGAEVVYQAALFSGRWGGWADFLERVARPSALGPFSYEVVDTKLKRRPDPKHMLQLALYADLLAQIQGSPPERVHVALGTGERASLRLADYAAYARAARARLERFVEERPPTRPIPCADCALCRWAAHCQSVWEEEDSLFLVAGITRGQVKKLEAAGITTMAQLAAHEGGVRGMAAATLERLTAQARLQSAHKAGRPAWELRPHQPGRGFDLLPAPQEGDLFYDIEGDPHYEGGLEYLHGVWDGRSFRAFWAHDHAEERAALAALLDFFRDHLARYPQARIYHYAPYEKTALRRLTMTYGIGEAFLDRLLREGRLVDLYAVVRGGLICSEPDYSIKSLEVFYDLERKGEVKTAGGSVVAYERWRETRDQAILDEIEDYNRIDCISTERLRDWLVSIRPDRPWPALSGEGAEKEAEQDTEAEALRAKLAAGGLDAARQELLFNLALFRRREAKPSWWAIYDSLGKEEEELIDDLDALAGLEAEGPPEAVKRSVLRRYRFPPQETKLRPGQRPSVPMPEGGFTSIALEEFDPRAGRLALKIGTARAEVLAERLTLHPPGPVGTKVIEAAIGAVIDDQLGPRQLQAVDDLLVRHPPRLAGRAAPIAAGDDPVADTVAAVRAMQHTVLPIQGPPGTGKTHVTAHAIMALLRAGARVGVASNSHAAIQNVLMGCVKALERDDPEVSFEIVHKVSGEDDGYPEDSPIRRTTDNGEAAAARHVVGGTAWFFARPDNEQAFDWLFVDEAGQVGLANMVAMARAAKNIVLVGDPRQLPQVIQGSHPPPANLSCLEWLLGDHATVPPERGIFLPVTRRMHPELCRFVSEQVYEGRLESHPDTARQAVSGTPFPPAGAFFVPVEHEGNAQSAPEEVAAIRAAVDALLAGRWTDAQGQTREMRPSDIIVVAPYNAQVNALRAGLPETIRVGTVDRFQGQEAAVSLVSMTASSAEEIPRGMEFLYSLNRINVAVSRARALSLVFASPRLREAKCTTLEQMRLVNTLCALPELPADGA